MRFICPLRRMCQAALSGALALLCMGAASAGDLLEAAAKGSLWSEPREKLARGVLKQAKYRKVDAKTYSFRGDDGLTLAGFAAKETLVQWDDAAEHVVSVSSALYNKGDDGPLEKADFETAVADFLFNITEVMKVQPKLRKVDRKEAGVKPKAWEWENEGCAVMLEAHATGAGKRYVSEFIRLTIAPDAASLERGGADDAVKKAELKKHVRTDADGDVWIEDVPMVDQGEKGYCVPAAISRVFAYYNMDGVDQHALAAICKSSGEEGTSIEAMSKALTSISSRFHVGITSWRWLNMKTLEKEYTKLAQRRGRFGGLEPKLLLEVVNSKPALLRKGLKDISKYIDSGIPVVWGVLLGLFPEQGLPQSMGGHMRLIIGYNKQKQTIIYTDSWGAGHEKKSMPLAQACAISQVLYVLRPLR